MEEKGDYIITIRGHGSLNDAEYVGRMARRSLLYDDHVIHGATLAHGQVVTKLDVASDPKAANQPLPDAAPGEEKPTTQVAPEKQETTLDPVA